jgi:hypothetical protein
MPFEFPFVAVRDAISHNNFPTSGQDVQNMSGTTRFFRMKLVNRICEPFFPSHLPQLPFYEDKDDALEYFTTHFGSNFYLMEFWRFIAQAMSNFIVKNGTEWVNAFLEYYSSYAMEEMILVESPCGSLLFSQEIEPLLPQKEAWFPASASLRPRAEVAMQKKAFSLGYLLSATSKNAPGSIAGRGVYNFKHGRTLVSSILNLFSTERYQRTNRESRIFAQAIELMNPRPLSAFNKDFPTPASISKHITELSVVIGNFPHNVPGMNYHTDSEWTPDATSNKDKILLFPEGQEALRGTGTSERVLSYEKYLHLAENAHKYSDFRVLADEYVRVGSFTARQVHVTYRESETLPNHVKVILSGAIKGITEPLQTRMVASHRILTKEDLPQFQNLINSKLLIPIEIGVAASTIGSKQSYGTLMQLIFARLAWEKNTSVGVPNMEQDQCINPKRTKDVESNINIAPKTPYGDFVNSIENVLESRGQDLTGKMFIYVNSDGKGWRLLKDKEGNPVKMVVGRIIALRSRNGDSQSTGGESKVFTPVSKTLSGGDSIDVHGTNIGGFEHYLPTYVQEEIDAVEKALKTLQRLGCRIDY